MGEWGSVHNFLPTKHAGPVGLFWADKKSGRTPRKKLARLARCSRCCDGWKPGAQTDISLAVPFSIALSLSFPLSPDNFSFLAHSRPSPWLEKNDPDSIFSGRATNQMEAQRRNSAHFLTSSGGRLQTSHSRPGFESSCHHCCWRPSQRALETRRLKSNQRKKSLSRCK